MPSTAVNQFIGEVESPRPRYTDVVSAANRVKRQLHVLHQVLNTELAVLPPCMLKTRAERVLRELTAGNLSDEDDELEIFAKATGHVPRPPVSTTPPPTMRQLKAAITRGTGLTGWVGCVSANDQDDETRQDVIDYFSDHHAILLTPETIKLVWFSRDFSSNHELNFIQLALTPVGIFVYDVATNTASGFSDFVRDLHGLETWLGKV